MTRADSASYLAGSLAQWLSDAGLGTTDVPGALAEVIDDALLMTGTAYDGLTTDPVVADGNELGFRRVLRYVGLVRIQDAIAHRVDVQLSTPSISKNRSQAVRQLDKIVSDAQKEALPFFTSSGAWSAGTIALDYLEPVGTY